MRGDLIPGNRSPRFARFFAGYCRRMMRRDFAHTRLTLGTAGVLSSLDDGDGPAIAALNHASWWDPLVGLVLADRFAPSRPLASPIESAQLRKFGFMRRLGLFGLDPASRESYGVFVEHALGLYRQNPRTLLGLTPQGTFADVRTPVRLRPGAGAVASRLSGGGTPARVVAVSCEYAFWHDRKPELLIHARACVAPDVPSTTAWTRAIAAAMERARVELTALSVARDASAFEPLFERAGPAVHPVYDLLLRLRGKRAVIEPGGTTA